MIDDLNFRIKKSLNIFSNSIVYTENIRVNYKNLYNYLLQIKKYIIDSHTVIFSLCDRNIESVVSLLFSLVFDKTFYPINPNLTEKEINESISSISGVVITDSVNSERINNFVFDNNVSSIIELNIHDFTVKNKNLTDQLIENSNKITRSRYIYCTSGSTGKRKLVLGNGYSLQDFLDWEINTFNITDKDSFINITRPFFDPYLRDILVPILTGSDIFIPSEQSFFNTEKLSTYISDYNISLMHTIPTIFKNLINKKKFLESSLRFVFLAGEPLYSKNIKFFYNSNKNGCKVVNLYGPTETTLAKFYKIVDKSCLNGSIVPVGKPISHKLNSFATINYETDMSIKEKSGEIVIHTEAASFGYLDAQMNKDSFFEKDGLCCFNTKDRGYIDENKNLVIVGRMDEIIKYNGEKINLNEISGHISHNENILNCCVINTVEKYNNILVAAVILNHNSNESIDNVRLQTNEYLHLNNVSVVPSIYIAFDEFPQLPNGKIDKTTLEEKIKMKLKKHTSPLFYDLEFNDVIEIIRDCTGGNVYNKWSLNDKLIDMGVDSLSMINIIISLEDKFNVNIDESSIDLDQLMLQDILKMVKR